jgi:hypothetical protein
MTPDDVAIPPIAITSAAIDIATGTKALALLPRVKIEFVYLSTTTPCFVSENAGY